MQRITIYETDEYGDQVRLGYFDLDAATHILTEGRRWDGSNHRGVISGLLTSLAELYRTSGGRWVVHTDASSEFNGPNRWEFLTDDEARDWVIRSHGGDAEEVLAEHFPDTPDESGPGPQGGRPSVGPKVETRLDEKTLAQVDARAGKEGVSRAEMLRRLVVAGL
jgi:hypothetical protein